MSHHVDCPDCKGAMRIRTSYALGQTMRRLTYECLNVECGASFAASITLDARLNMPAQPSMTVVIPVSSHVNRARIRAVLDGAPETDYEPRSLPRPNGELFGAPESGAGPPLARVA